MLINTFLLCGTNLSFQLQVESEKYPTNCLTAGSSRQISKSQPLEDARGNDDEREEIAAAKKTCVPTTIRFRQSRSECLGEFLECFKFLFPSPNALRWLFGPWKPLRILTFLAWIQEQKTEIYESILEQVINKLNPFSLDAWFKDYQGLRRMNIPESWYSILFTKWLTRHEWLWVTERWSE